MARPLVPGSASALKPQVRVGMVEQLHKPDRDVDQRVAVAPAGLDQHHPRRGVLAQPVSEDAAGRASADNHVIRLHRYVLPCDIHASGIAILPPLRVQGKRASRPTLPGSCLLAVERPSFFMPQI